MNMRGGIRRRDQRGFELMYPVGHHDEFGRGADGKRCGIHLLASIH